MCGPRNGSGGKYHRKWPPQSLRLALLFIGVAWIASCGHLHDSAQEIFDQANREFLHGDLKQSQNDAQRGYQKFFHSNLTWAWRFRILEAKAALWRGLYGDVLEILAPLPDFGDQADLAISKLTILGVANINTHNFRQAERLLTDATKLCDTSDQRSCGYLLQARGLLASAQDESTSAEKFYELSLSFARSHGDRFLESDSLLNLGAESLELGHFDEAIDRSGAAYEIADTIGAESLKPVTQGNIGWAYYKLGDSNRALGLFLDAEKRAGDLDNPADQGAWLTDAGYVYLGDRKFDVAEQSFRYALELEKRANSKEEIYNIERALARLFIQTDNIEQAEQYAEQARQLARESGSHIDELYPILVEGQVAARRNQFLEAEETFQLVEQDKSCPVFLRWEAQHSLAQLYQDENQANAADRQYQAALSTFESARVTVKHEDSQLSFLTNAARIYDDYIHFLIGQKKPDEALRWADYSRARTLSEGLGLLSKSTAKREIAQPSALNAKEISRRAEGTLLFYWLGEKQSYLWAITPHKTSLFQLPPAAEIDSLVQGYRKSLNGPQDVLASSEEARALYRALIAPAQPLANGSRVFVIPDGSLNNLSFETLVVSEPSPVDAKLTAAKPTDPKPHFWIEDADVVNASSLRVLAASLAKNNMREKKRKLLLVGNSVAPNQDYPELPRAAEQMTDVARHFPSPQVYQRGQATPAAYLGSHPEEFSHIHFVAHGTASRLSPLDSAIVLSPDSAGNESFKLYAREIIKLPLRADLVTISACYGAGERAYSGEGLVGLAWAFLRAGAHNVIASLWEVTDTSTEQLMDRFYDELDKGASPDAALRTAKLSLLHGSAFRNPFYWAPFQLYTGS